MSDVSFQYTLDPSWAPASRELVAARGIEFQYVMFPGDVACVIGGVSLSLLDGALPLLEFAMLMRDGVDRVCQVPSGIVTITVNDSAYGYDLRRLEDRVEITRLAVDEAAVSARCPAWELEREVRRAGEALVQDLEAHWPPLLGNDAFRSIARYLRARH